MYISLKHTVLNIDNFKVVRIMAPADFTFIWYRKFRDLYKNELSIGSKFIIDFTNTTLLSASSLKMILLLKDQVNLIGGEVTLVNLNSKQPIDLLSLYNFNHYFDITFDEGIDVKQNEINAMNNHGSYSITTDSQIATIKAYDAWNIETVLSFCEAYKAEVKNIIHRSWSCIVDLSEWELGPPGLLNEIKKLNIWSEENNQSYEAVIIKDSLQQQLLESTQSVFNNTQSQFFDNYDEAFHWISRSQRSSK